MTDFIVYICPECGHTRKWDTGKEGVIYIRCSGDRSLHTETTMVQCWPVTKTEEKNSEEEQKRNQVLSQFKGYAKALAYQEGIELAFIMETIMDYLKREKV